MAKKPKKAAGPVVPTTIHEAMLATDGSGTVFRGSAIDEPTAIARRTAGGDVVVCGSDLTTNRTQHVKSSDKRVLRFCFTTLIRAMDRMLSHIFNR